MDIYFSITLFTLNAPNLSAHALTAQFLFHFSLCFALLLLAPILSCQLPNVIPLILLSLYLTQQSSFLSCLCFQLHILFVPTFWFMDPKSLTCTL